MGNDIAQETKKDTLEVIAQELAKSNELIAIEKQKKRQIKKRIVEIIGIILFVLFICSIYDKWNQIWYEFGQNIYKLTH